jgi:hypothetical protein
MRTVVKTRPPFHALSDVLKANNARWLLQAAFTVTQRRQQACVVFPAQSHRMEVLLTEAALLQLQWINTSALTDWLSVRALSLRPQLRIKHSNPAETYADGRKVS